MIIWGVWLQRDEKGIQHSSYAWNSCSGCVLLHLANTPVVHLCTATYKRTFCLMSNSASVGGAALLGLDLRVTVAVGTGSKVQVLSHVHK